MEKNLFSGSDNKIKHYSFDRNKKEDKIFLEEIIYDIAYNMEYHFRNFFRDLSIKNIILEEIFEQCFAKKNMTESEISEITKTHIYTHYKIINDIIIKNDEATAKEEIFIYLYQLNKFDKEFVQTCVEGIFVNVDKDKLPIPISTI